MITRIILFACLAIHVIQCFSQPFADKEYYLVDSLPYSNLAETDRSLVDSVLRIYHKSGDKQNLLLINEIVETTWDNRVWPKYNYWILKQLQSRDQSSLDSVNRTLLAGCLINHGYYLRLLGNSQKALDYYKNSYEEYEKLENKEGLAFCLNNMGVVHDNLGDLPKALECYHGSLKIQESIGEQEGEANSLSNIGEVHRVLGDFDVALDFFNKSLKIQLEIGNKRGEAMTLVKIADIKVEKLQYDEAQQLFEKALEIDEEIDEGYGAASVLKELGKLAFIKKEYNQAIRYLNKAEPQFIAFQDVEELAKNRSILAEVYLKVDSLNKAKTNAQLAFESANELEFIELISSTASTLSKIYEIEGDINRSHDLLKLHIRLKDSVRSVSNKNLTIRMQLQHDYDKQKTIDDKEREKQVLLAQAEENRQKVISLAFAVIGLLTVFFAIIIFKRLKITKKQKEIILETNEELNQINEEILAQRDEIESQKDLVETKNFEITSSIEYAKRIQEAILPTDEHIKKYLPHSFVLYLPKDVVAGDFYWVEAIGDKVFFAVADCTGHGVPGAMVSVVCHGALNRSVREYKLSKPSEILDKTRELVLQTFDKSAHQVKDGMDICLCVWDTNSTTIEYAGANNPLYLLKDDKIEIIKADRQPIGFSDLPRPFSNQKIDLKEVSSIFLFTDGYADQFGGALGKKLGHKKFREKIIELSSESIDNQKDSLNSYFHQWRSNEEQLDDVCVIGVKFK